MDAGANGIEPPGSWIRGVSACRHCIRVEYCLKTWPRGQPLKDAGLYGQTTRHRLFPFPNPRAPLLSFAMSIRTDQIQIDRKPFEGEVHDVMGGSGRWEVKVHDHGLVALVDVMPRMAPAGKTADFAIVQAARVSYGEGTKLVNEDRGLIRYLMRHRHTTPMEMVEFKFHHVMPIFVARQWIRHRTANVNEYSARYSILDNEFYIPAPEHLAAQAATNRQGRGDVLEGAAARRVLDLLREDSQRAYAGYAEMLNEDAAGNPADPTWPGLARELARMNLSLNFYTQWYWKTDLHNLMHFLTLRADPHAQYEIRAYADRMIDTLERWVPLAHAAFREYRMNAATISATGIEVIQRMLAGEQVEQKTSGLSPREWRELMTVLKREP